MGGRCCLEVEQGGRKPLVTAVRQLCDHPGITEGREGAWSPGDLSAVDTDPPPSW